MVYIIQEDNLEKFVNKIVENNSNLITFSHSTFDVNDQGIGYSVDYICGKEKMNQKIFLSYLEQLSGEVEQKFEDIEKVLVDKYGISSEFNKEIYSLKINF